MPFGDLVMDISHDRALIAWLTGVSLLMLVGTVVAGPLVLARLEPDHFTRSRKPPTGARARHPALALAGKLVKNLLGIVFLVFGVAMLVVPGPGLLTILLGFSLVDFPGRRRLQLAVLRQRHVRRAVDRLRARAGRPPLEMGHAARERAR